MPSRSTSKGHSEMRHSVQCLYSERKDDYREPEESHGFMFLNFLVGASPKLCHYIFFNLELLKYIVPGP